MGLQRLSINPGIANPKSPRPAVGDQVQGPHGVPSLLLFLKPPADRCQGIVSGSSDRQQRRLGSLQQPCNLRAMAVAHQQLMRCQHGALQSNHHKTSLCLAFDSNRAMAFHPIPTTPTN
ncbi:hypothetical protein KR49_05870 [Synechococcus sp. KORDI-49]|nr:hypothetical protein KR49_05870 [Synechococcus sp. KORDI-49]